MSLPLRLSSHLVRIGVRHFHRTAKSCLLVGPIDPISHMRPVIYDDQPSVEDSLTNHPYSLSEFNKPSATAVQNELQLKLQLQQLDAVNQTFWTDSNTRFEAGKAAILSSLPEGATPVEKERALSEFYKQWVMQEDSRLEDYGANWRRRSWTTLSLSSRVAYQRLKGRFSNQ
ncbi:hypothetical protein BDN72DRAFT_808877 [Pluteus cervinus]|uniref:Uncharacterized protein n=1 Tax=Pluteus cervinus TaxID=181527 RepID=A0ACD3BET3_9AGAR|nr:hypothetical protein BDN72DRAFT_808877 [Pluteus cervinus]